MDNTEAINNGDSSVEGTQNSMNLPSPSKIPTEIGGGECATPDIDDFSSSVEPFLFEAMIENQKFMYRILKLKESIFIYIGPEECEVFDEMAMAMPGVDNEIVSTKIVGSGPGCDSECLAQKISKRLQKPVYLSCSIPVDRVIRPAIEARLIDEINNHACAFF